MTNRRKRAKLVPPSVLAPTDTLNEIFITIKTSVDFNYTSLLVKLNRENNHVSNQKWNNGYRLRTIHDMKRQPRSDKKMLIALAHGSRNPEWRASVERQIGSLQDRLGNDIVQLAYMDHSPPTLMDVVEAAVQHGITHIRVLPLFLSAEGHVTKDIAPMVRSARDAVGLADLELLPPIGQHRAFRELLLSIASESSPEVD